MKKNYEEAELEIVEIRDVVTASLGIQDPDPEGGLTIPTI